VNRLRHTGLLLFVLFLLPGYTSAIEEQEPNNSEGEANPAGAGTIQGLANDSHDWYRINLPAPGPVRLRVTGLPGSTKVQIGVKGFPHVGWQDGEGGVHYSFEAEQPEGYVWVKLQFAESVCGFDWCAARLEAGGPWYGVRPTAGMPGSHNGESILRQVPKYSLVIETANLVNSNQVIKPGSFEEQEPNNSEDQANPAGAGSIQGLANDDNDWYKLSLPALGPVRMRITGLPASTKIQIGVKGFPHVGWQDGEGNAEYSFEAERTEGHAWVKLQFAESVCGFDWCAARLVPGGPWYGVRPSADMPATHNGEPILRQVPRYTLLVEMAGGQGSGQSGRPENIIQQNGPGNESVPEYDPEDGIGG